MHTSSADQPSKSSRRRASLDQSSSFDGSSSDVPIDHQHDGIPMPQSYPATYTGRTYDTAERGGKEDATQRDRNRRAKRRYSAASTKSGWPQKPIPNTNLPELKRSVGNVSKRRRIKEGDHRRFEDDDEEKEDVEDGEGQMRDGLFFFEGNNRKEGRRPRQATDGERLHQDGEKEVASDYVAPAYLLPSKLTESPPWTGRSTFDNVPTEVSFERDLRPSVIEWETFAKGYEYIFPLGPLSICNSALNVTIDEVISNRKGKVTPTSLSVYILLAWGARYAQDLHWAIDFYHTAKEHVAYLSRAGISDYMYAEALNSIALYAMGTDGSDQVLAYLDESLKICNDLGAMNGPIFTRCLHGKYLLALAKIDEPNNPPSDRAKEREMAWGWFSNEYYRAKRAPVYEQGTRERGPWGPISQTVLEIMENFTSRAVVSFTSHIYALANRWKELQESTTPSYGQRDKEEAIKGDQFSLLMSLRQLIEKFRSSLEIPAPLASAMRLNLYALSASCYVALELYPPAVQWASLYVTEFKSLQPLPCVYLMYAEMDIIFRICEHEEDAQMLEQLLEALSDTVKVDSSSRYLRNRCRVVLVTLRQKLNQQPLLPQIAHLYNPLLSATPPPLPPSPFAATSPASLFAPMASYATTLTTTTPTTTTTATSATLLPSHQSSSSYASFPTDFRPPSPPSTPFPPLSSLPTAYLHRLPRMAPPPPSTTTTTTTTTTTPPTPLAAPFFPFVSKPYPVHSPPPSPPSSFSSPLPPPPLPAFSAFAARPVAADDGDEEKVVESSTPPAPPKRCQDCNAATTPEWRTGPNGPGTLCNACGLRYRRVLQAAQRKGPGTAADQMFMKFTIPKKKP